MKISHKISKVLNPINSQVALIAHAIDSRKFYLCAVGKNAILLQCEDNKVFDGEKSLCMSR